MFKAGTTTPKLGEIRYGLVEGSNNTHRYVGIRPYLIVSNDKYNEFSGQAEVIPFTTKTNGEPQPSSYRLQGGRSRRTLQRFHISNRGSRHVAQ